MKKSASSLISILLVLFLMACSSSENNIVKNIENENQTTEDSFDSHKIGDLKKSTLEHFVIENPNYKKENLESRWVEVINIQNSNEQFFVTVKDQESNERLILKNETQDLSSLQVGENIIIVTTKTWLESNPLQNNVLKLVHLQ
ncbi:hypothetical protein M4D81_34270 [Paenibacillus sp. p3-SID867]|uniref:hypothetical protein n=1 Tax=Paenibacillus sp. p3-SID867 TaxID=2916363 RepID=UPI0021A51903|nr:hypothetical protein [Paenibacillus sp. p3-SID867]MCT1404076.1 hypothetical protein [Paenibacillus sp. p3-SID867]